jgi:oligopeptide transport system ATP-binding protein
VSAPLLVVDKLHKEYPAASGWFGPSHPPTRAVIDISFAIARGRSFGLVGETGSGKSTVGRCVAGLIPPTGGQIWFGGENLAQRAPAARGSARRSIQMVFQDAGASLNPRMTVFDIVEEPLAVIGSENSTERRRHVEAMLESVGLTRAHGGRYPHQLSGGQRQRVAIARAIITKPDLVVCDEPISALDVSVQAQVINLLRELQARFGLTYLFIAHGLAAVRHVCDDVGVMYLGRLVEVADSDTLFRFPKHPYTQALLSAVAVPDPEIESTRTRTVLRGDPASTRHLPGGCAFHPRCPALHSGVRGLCEGSAPALVSVGGNAVACHLAGAPYLTR